MLDPVVPAAFEHVKEAGHVRADIGMRVVERIADAGLGGEMNDALRPLLGEGRLDDSPVGEIALDEGKSLLLHQALEPGLLQRHIVIGAEIVEADDSMAAVEKPRRRMVANEAGGAGNQDTHRDAFLRLEGPSPKSRESRSHPAVPLSIV